MKIITIVAHHAAVHSTDEILNTIFRQFCGTSRDASKQVNGLSANAIIIRNNATLSFSVDPLPEMSQSK